MSGPELSKIARHLETISYTLRDILRAMCSHEDLDDKARCRTCGVQLMGFLREVEPPE